MVTIPRPGLYYDSGGLLDPFNEGYKTANALRGDVAKTRAGNALAGGDYAGAANAVFAQDPDLGLRIQAAAQKRADDLRTQTEAKRKAEADAHAQVATMLQNVRRRTKDPAALLHTYDAAASYLAPHNTPEEIAQWRGQLAADPDSAIAALGVAAAKQQGLHVFQSGDETIAIDDEGREVGRWRGGKSMAVAPGTKILDIPGSAPAAGSDQGPVGGATAPSTQAASSGQDGGAGAAAPTTPGAPSPDVVADRRARVASIETRGQRDPYTAVGRPTQHRDGSTDRPYGKYQVMGANIGPWTQEVLGRSMSPQEFLASPQAQDAVFDAKFHQFAQKYGSDADAASVWFTGRPQAEGAGRRDVLGTTGADYVRRFSAGGAPQAPMQLASAGPSGTDAAATAPAAAAPAAPGSAAPGQVSGQPRVIFENPREQKVRLTPDQVAQEQLPPGTVAYRNPDGGLDVAYKPPTANEKISDVQRKTASLTYAALGGNDRMNELAKRGIYKPSSPIESLIKPGKNRLIQIVARKPEDRAFIQAATEFLAPILRKESGAAVTYDELMFYKDVLVPTFEDDPNTLWQKALARDRKLQASYNEAKAAYDDQFGAPPKWQVLTDPRGQPKAPGPGGKTWPAPVPKSVARLKANPTPAERQMFEQAYGPGSAARALGGR